MKKLLKFLDEQLECTICMTLLAVFTVLLFIQVIMRYVFNNSLAWSEELARYMFIWLVYIGISFGAKQMKHLKIDAFLKVFPKASRPFVALFAEILVLGFSLFVVYSGYTMVMKIGKLGTRSTALEIPMKYVYAAPMVGFGLTAIREVQNIIFRIKSIREGREVE